MPLIVEANEAYADLYASVTGPGTQVVRDLDELRRLLEATPTEYAVVLGAGVNLEAALALSDSLRIKRPSLSVLLVRRRVDTLVLSEALRAGMREVLEDRDLTGLGAAVERARQLWEAINQTSAEIQAKNGRLITVFSPKGGVGKTTLSTNIALALAANPELSVCLLDLDLAFGDVAITLQLIPSRTMEDVLQLHSGLDYEILETLLTPHSSGLKVLAAPIQPHTKDNLSPHVIGNVLRLLKSNFDIVVADSAPALDEHVLQAIDQTDALVIVSTLDVPTLKNVKVAIETLELLNFPLEKRHLVLNRADEKVGLKHEDVEATLGMRIEAAIPMSPQVAQATNSGDPIVHADPRHLVSRALRTLAERLTAGHEPTKHGTKEQPKAPVVEQPPAPVAEEPRPVDEEQPREESDPAPTQANDEPQEPSTEDEPSGQSEEPTQQKRRGLFHKSKR